MVLLKNFSGSNKSQSCSFSVSAADIKQEMWCVNVFFFYFKQKVHSKLVFIENQNGSSKTVLDLFTSLLGSFCHIFPTFHRVCRYKRLIISLFKWVETLCSRIDHLFINQIHFISSRKIIEWLLQKHQSIAFLMLLFLTILVFN